MKQFVIHYMHDYLQDLGGIRNADIKSIKYNLNPAADYAHNMQDVVSMC